MKLFSNIILGILFLFSFLNTATGSETLVISGTGDSQMVLQKLAALFEQTHPDTQIIVPNSVGSGGGIKALLSGTAGLARTARALKPREQAKGLTQIPFAASPIVFAAHPSMAMVKNITIDEVINVYNGRILNSKELGGEDHKIYPVDRETGDSSRQVIDTYLKSVLKKSKGIESAGKFFYTTGETVKAIARNRFSMGYIPFSAARDAQLHIMSLDSVFPGQTTIQNGRYPLVTTLYLVKTATPGQLAQTFLLFLKKGPAQDLMRESGVFPLEK